MGKMPIADMVRYHKHVVCLRTAKAVPKGRRYQMVADYRMINEQVEFTPLPVSNRAAISS